MTVGVVSRVADGPSGATHTASAGAPASGASGTSHGSAGRPLPGSGPAPPSRVPPTNRDIMLSAVCSSSVSRTASDPSQRSSSAPGSVISSARRR